MPDGTRALVAEAHVDLARLSALAARLARAAVPGDLILLYGPLGAGKTTFVREFARHAGVAGHTGSPSFTIANIYSGRFSINHLDLYRLDCLEEEDTLDLDEYVSGDAVTLVEWPEAGADRLGPPDYVVRLEHETLETRSVLLEARSEEAELRWKAAA